MSRAGLGGAIGIMADETALDLVRAHMQDVRVPSHHDKVNETLKLVKCGHYLVPI